MFNAGVNENLALFLIEKFTHYFCAFFLKNDVKINFMIIVSDFVRLYHL